MKISSAVFMTSILMFIALQLAAGSGKGLITVEPHEIFGLLVNPGMGFETFFSVNSDEMNERVPMSRLAYSRYYWDELEPEEGKFDFSKFDEDIRKARENNQDYSFRVMCEIGYVTKCPQWLLEKGAKGSWRIPRGEENKDAAKTVWVPDYGDPIFLTGHERLIRKLGERYNGHPDIDHIDIGSVGLWGEWGSVKRSMATWAVLKRIIDFYLKYFDKTHKVMLINNRYGLEYAVSNGCGWRADCLGDMGGFGGWFMHMDYYQEQLDAARANDAWKRAPVCFEVCWRMTQWDENDWDVDWILEEALRMHCSVVNGKSAPTPVRFRPIVNKFQKRMGYRLVLRKLQLPKIVQSGSNLLVDWQWENIGVAPPYRPYPVVLELRGEKHKGVRLQSKADLRDWLPGRHEILDTFAVPKLPVGKYGVYLGLLDPHYRTADVMLAIEGRQEDGFYHMADIEVTDEITFKEYETWKLPNLN
jgi:hypothetical protein